jgi:SAM-dependent methyltransferase
MLDILGTALLDYHSGKYTEDIKTYSSLDEEDSIPLPYLFRCFEEMPLLEQKALEMARGTILDIGCGAGNHALYLQKKGFDVTALDASKGAIEICKNRGVTSSVHNSFLDYNDSKFDTLLLLMNGIGLAGKLNNLSSFLNHLKSLLQPKGQVLLDSSNIIYMFEEDEDGGFWVPNNGGYYGEVTFVMEYKKQKSAPFEWLYLDFATLHSACSALDLNCELVREGEHYDYLAKLSLKS